ncbi:MAG: hypothetical protein U0575_12015 [Phycisphaerales bacterium]
MSDVPEPAPETAPESESEKSTDAIRGVVTQLLTAASGGDHAAARAQLLNVRGPAPGRPTASCAASSATTLEATALVHEAWLRLAGQHSAVAEPQPLPRRRRDGGTTDPREPCSDAAG